MTLTIDPDKVATIIREVAATVIMPRFGQLAASDVVMKAGESGPVTIADREAEEALSVLLTDHLPGSKVFGEESYAQNPALLSLLGTQTPLWIIDPIDGTKSFVAGQPFFGVMVALVIQQEVIASWILDPVSGDMLTAEKGAGVWLGVEKMRLASNDPELPVLGLCGGKISKLLDIIRDYKTETYVKLPDLKQGKCSVFDYSRMMIGTNGRLFAKSEKSRITYLLYRRTEPWDHASGSLMMRELGAYTANWAGQPYDFRDMTGGLLYASDQETWHDIRKALEPVLSLLNARLSSNSA